jgi:hypothetical protein
MIVIVGRFAAHSVVRDVFGELLYVLDRAAAFRVRLYSKRIDDGALDQSMTFRHGSRATLSVAVRQRLATAATVTRRA